MPCPSDEVLAAWNAGALPPSEQDVVESHAAGCAACRGLAIALAGVRPRTAPGGLGAEGAIIGRYRVLGAIGEGAMGVVLRGHDPVLDREVAIKMSRSVVATAAQRERMVREAQTLARLDHANVVRVFDAGIIGDEMFVAMEYVVGVTLSRWLAGAPRSVAQRLAVLAGVGSGIAAVHAAGLVHRDIKPDNILVRESGAGVLVDFGLARAAGWSESGPAGSGIAGTPRYLAPELRAGALATPASDQFAWWTVVDEVMRDTPRLAAAIARGTSATPEARFPSMTAALAALAPRRRWPWLAAAGVLAVAGVTAGIALRHEVDPCAIQSPARWAHERPAIALGLGAAGADVGRVLAAIDARARRTVELRAETCRAARSGGDDERTHALREQLCVDESWRRTELLFAGLEDLSPHMVREAVDQLIEVLPLERCATGAIPAIPAPPPAASFQAAREVDKQLREITLGTDEDPAHREQQLRALEAPIRALHDTTSEARWRNALAAVALTRGDANTARTELDAVVRIAEAAGDDDVRTVGLINQLMLAANTGAPDTTALEHNAEAAAARLGNPAISAQLHSTIGTIRYMHGDMAAAAAALHDAVRELEAIAIGPHGQLVRIAGTLGGVEEQLGHHAASRTTLDHGYELARRRFGETAPETLELRAARAVNMLDDGDIEAARPELVAVAAALERALGPSSTKVLQTRTFICQCDVEAGVDAAASCDTVVAGADRAYGASSPQLAWQLMLVARARLRSGRAAEAVELLERALRVTERGAIDPGDRPNAEAYLAIALAQRDPARAATLARSAAEALRGMPAQAKTLAELERVFPGLR